MDKDRDSHYPCATYQWGRCVLPAHRQIARIGAPSLLDGISAADESSRTKQQPVPVKPERAVKIGARGFEPPTSWSRTRFQGLLKFVEARGFLMLWIEPFAASAPLLV